MCNDPVYQDSFVKLMGIPFIPPHNGPLTAEVQQTPRLRQYILSEGDDNEYHLDDLPWRPDDGKTLQLPPRMKRELIEKIRKFITQDDVQAFRRRDHGIY